MSHEINVLDHIDDGGAIAERAAEVHEAVAEGATRADFLKRFAVGAGGAVVAGSMLAPGAALAADTKASPAGDLTILNYALTLEYLEAAFYMEARDRGRLSGEDRQFAKVVFDHEQAHVVAITATIKKLGGRPVRRPRFDFGNTTGSRNVFRQTSLALEETGVTAYHGQVPFIFNKTVLQAAAGIAAVESRHATWMRTILGYDPAPLAVERTRTQAGVLRIVESTGFIQG